MYDAWLKKEITLYINVLFSADDLKALPLISGQRQIPAILHACKDCWIEALRFSSASLYPGAIQYLLQTSRIARFLRREYVNNAPACFHGFVNLPPHTIKTDTESRAAQILAEEKNALGIDYDSRYHSAWYAGYKYMGAFEKWCPALTGTVSFHRNDLMHITENVMKDILHLLQNREPMDLTPQRLEDENANGRWDDLKQRTEPYLYVLIYI